MGTLASPFTPLSSKFTIRDSQNSRIVAQSSPGASSMWETPRGLIVANGLVQGNAFCFNSCNPTSGSITLDLSQGNVQEVVLNGNTTVALSNPAIGQVGGYTFVFLQSGGGGFTVTWPGTLHGGLLVGGAGGTYAIQTCNVIPGPLYLCTPGTVGE
jgi:hypothetical protein